MNPSRIVTYTNSMDRPKLILLDGFAGVGKTTLAKRYIADHPLAMDLEGDEIIVMLGQWLKYENAARELLFKIGKAIITSHLESGYDIVVPCLPTNVDHQQAFEDIAKSTGAQFFEVVLVTDREEAIRRLLKRGTWGEAGTDPLTNADLPVIKKLYDDMDKTLAERPKTTRILSVEDSHDSTYQQFLVVVGETPEIQDRYNVHNVAPSHYTSVAVPRFFSVDS
jgi:adenylylsulfate kinase-like enzyme